MLYLLLFYHCNCNHCICHAHCHFIFYFLFFYFLLFCFFSLEVFRECFVRVIHYICCVHGIGDSIIAMIKFLAIINCYGICIQITMVAISIVIIFSEMFQLIQNTICKCNFLHYFTLPHVSQIHLYLIIKVCVHVINVCPKYLNQRSVL